MLAEVQLLKRIGGEKHFPPGGEKLFPQGEELRFPNDGEKLFPKGGVRTQSWTTLGGSPCIHMKNE